jgi:hypothetical protein
MHSAEEAPVRRDHLWVLVVIAAAALAEVWGSWVGIGSISGFPVLLGRIPTDWVLALVMEGYWAYGLYAWLAASPGPRSRSFAMWSCGAVFILSLVGQVTYHEMTVPPDTPIGRRAVVGFVTVLPVTGLALIAVLIHLRHADREETAAKALKRLDAERRAAEAAARAERQAAAERAEADERTHLRAELDRVSAAAEDSLSDLRAELTGELDAARTARADAEAALGSAQSQAETLARKLEAAERKLSRAAGGSGSRKQNGTGSRKPAAVPAPAAAEGTPQTVPEAPPDLDAESAVLWYVDQGLSASAAGVAAGLSDSRGRQIVRKLTAPAPAGVDPVAGAGNGGSPAETGSGND